MENQKVAYLIKNRSAYGYFIVVVRRYHENATENFLKHFVFDRAIFQNGLCFPKIVFIYKIKGNTNILNQDVQKKDVHLPDIFSKQLGHHIGKFVFSLPNSSAFINLLTPKGNLLNEINLESMNLFNPKDIFKIPQENLVKIAINGWLCKWKLLFI